MLNNTSASDFFPGWPNGVAIPREVSNVPFDAQQQVLVHIVPWWGTPSHPNIGYNSADPVYISKLVADLKRRHIAGATWLWNGVGGQMDKACLAMKPQFEAAGLKFAIMLSSTIPTIQAATDDAGRTRAMNAVVDYLRSKFFFSTAQLRIGGGRPQLFFFGFANEDFDWVSVRSHMHGMGNDEALCIFRMEQTYGAHLCADGYFGWMDNSDAWVTFAKKFGKPLVMGINGGFNNTFRAGTVVNCTWGAPHVIEQQGGIKMQTSLAQAAKYPEIPQVQIGTWNDYQEGTPIETGIDSHQSLLLALEGSRLRWNDLGPAFNHYEIHCGSDVRTVPVGSTSIELVAPSPGVYAFSVVGIGRPSVQNVYSSSLILKLTLTPQWSLA